MILAFHPDNFDSRRPCAAIEMVCDEYLTLSNDCTSTRDDAHSKAELLPLKRFAHDEEFLHLAIS